MGSQIEYFEDYQIGQKGVTHTRTLTEADIVTFAGLTDDFSRVHTDRHFAKGSVYGERVAHGLLGASLVAGMLSLVAPHIVGRGVPGAYFWGSKVDYRGGLKLGDTLRIEWSIAEKADDPAHQGFGLVKTGFRMVVQDGSSPYEGTLTTLARKKSAKAARLELKPEIPWEYRPFVHEPDRVYCMEDYPVDTGSESEARTISEADIVRFAGLTGDYNPQYVDADFSRQTQFGERIAHGLLVFSVANGMWVRDSERYLQPKPGIAGHLGDNLSFLAPVKIGDTIRCRYKIVATRASKSKPELGLVTRGLQVINQRNEVVSEGTTVHTEPTREGLRAQKG